jgi:hypothetical protein
MYSISMCVKHNDSVTFEHTGRIVDGTCINKGILHDKPNAASFFADGKDAGNVAKLAGHELQIEHRQVKTEKGLTKFPQWATETADGKQTVYKTSNCTSLPLGQTITYAPNKDVKVSFKLVLEISDGEEYISDDDEVQIVVPTPNAEGGSAGGAAVKSEKDAADKAKQQQAAADKAEQEKAAAENALRVQQINAQAAEKIDELKVKLQEVDTLKKEIFKLRVSAAELTPDDDITYKKIPVLVRDMVTKTTQNAFTAFRAMPKNEQILRKWELTSNKMLIQDQKPDAKPYNNRNVMLMMGNFYKLWAEENPTRAAKYEKQAKDFNEENKLDKAKAAVENKRKVAKKLANGGAAGSKKRRTDDAKKGSDDADEKQTDDDDDDDEDFNFNGAGYDDTD